MDRFLLAAAGAFLIFLPTGRAADVTPLMRDAAAKILHEGSPGVAMAVISNGQVSYFNAGTSERPGLPITNQTLFEVASITKIFTTTLLGIDVARGEKSLNDPVQKYLPGFRLRPKFEHATLEMLGTFTAGLPESPADFQGLSPSQRGTDHYSVRRFLKYISRFSPATRLPGPRAYGDTSVGLLGLCLGHLNLDLWNDRLNQEIFGPLDMPDTVLRLTPAQEQRLARGVKPGNKAAPRWPVDAIAAADGMKSTTSDMAQFLLAALGENPNASPDLEAGMAIATKARFPVHFHDFTEFQALAWRKISLTIDGRPLWIVTKSGDLPGYSSEIAYSRDLGIGVVILANLSQLSLTDIETDLMKRVAVQAP